MGTSRLLGGVKEVGGVGVLLVCGSGSATWTLRMLVPLLLRRFGGVTSEERAAHFSLERENGAALPAVRGLCVSSCTLQGGGDELSTSCTTSCLYASWLTEQPEHAGFKQNRVHCS